MFLTSEQVNQLQELCEKVAGNQSRSGKVTIEIWNNMPRVFDVEEPVYDGDHNQIGAVIHKVRVVLPAEEIAKGRQKNRMEGKRK